MAVLCVTTLQARVCAQGLPVGDTAVETETAIIDGEMADADATLTAIEQATEGTFTEMTTPTPVTGGLGSLDAGASKKVADETASFGSDIAGASSTSTESGALETSDTAQLKSVAEKGMISGNIQGELAEEERNTFKNIEGRAQSSLATFAERYTAADSIQGQVDALTSMHAVMVWCASLLGQLMKTNDYLGAAVSEGTAATTEVALQTNREYLQAIDDRDRTAKAMTAPAIPAL
jgi:hypothetical protein